MGLPLYVAPVESDVRHKSSLPGSQRISRNRGTRNRSSEFLLETRRRAILAHTTAAMRFRDVLNQDPLSETAAAHRSSQDRDDQDDQPWRHPWYAAEPYSTRTPVPVEPPQSIFGPPPGEGFYDNPLAARSSTALPVSARDQFLRRRTPDGPLDSARYNTSERDPDSLLALFSEHWAVAGPGTGIVPGVADDGRTASTGNSGARVPTVHHFALDGFVDEGPSPFATESDTDGNGASGRAMRFRRRRSQRHASSTPLGMAQSASGRPTVDWSVNHERPRSRSPVSSSRIFGGVSHLRGAEVIYPEERTRRAARTERYRTHLHRAAQRSARDTSRAADNTTGAHRSGNIRTIGFGPTANSTTVAPGHSHLPPFRYIFGPVDGLGDRQRSLSPEGDGVWDRLQTTVTPDPQPPSVSSSFVSFASGPAPAENNDDDADAREPDHGSDEDEDDATMTLASGTLPAELREADAGEDADCLEGGTTATSTLHDAERSRMQQFLRNLAQRADIPDEWWAEVGLSRAA